MRKKTQLGQIPEDWEVKRVEEFARVVGGGTPSTKKEEYFNGDIAWITPKDLSGYEQRYISQGERNITKKGLDNSSAKILPQGTVLVSSRAPIGYVAIANNEVSTNQGFRSLVPKDNINSEYLYYLIKTYKKKLENLASGSTFKELRGSTLAKAEFPIATEEEQRKITDILSSLDQKIELNREMNETLEDTGKAIFKHWFIDFEFPWNFEKNEFDLDGEPYKSGGGEFENNIPKSWKTTKFEDLIKITSGKRPENKNENKTDEFWCPVVGASSVNSFTTEELYNEPILVIGRVGTHGIVQRFKNPCWPSDNTLVITSPYYEFVCQYLNTISYSKLNRGSTQPLITQRDLKSLELALPREMKVLNYFENFANDLFEKMHANELENKRLSKIRDLLLPRLMSGRIRIK